MIRIDKYLLFTVVGLCGLGWAACTQERSPCLTPLVASLNMETMHLLTDTSTIFVDTALPAAVLRPVTNTKNDSGTLYPQQSDYTISLSPDDTVCKWIFTTDSAYYAFDTLTFVYQRSLQFISNACGYTYFYTLDTVYTNTAHKIIDSLLIVNKSVTNNVNITHLHLYIHPDY